MTVTGWRAVLTVDKTDCRSSRPLKARLPAGRIASVTAQESRCTSRYDATWIIRGDPGQRVNITLLDFNAAAHLGRRIPAAASVASKPEVAVKLKFYGTDTDTDTNTDFLADGLRARALAH